ncbi:hypothetical protein Y032_0682g1494 [Ancylostoma ceylanicum]|uniref:PH domain-containing protein n=1 Tax=Ancylostoma ceylanicum TaxID=53326 RepID=A0A016WHC4_9BILA|nr:hypothetical protein Y032_0682g1494 [Ancylostoma ceylanicum]
MKEVLLWKDSSVCREESACKINRLTDLSASPFRLIKGTDWVRLERAVRRCLHFHRGVRMEEDNAHDIFKWFNTLGPPQQSISVNFREETYNAELTLRGNLLTCISTIDAKVPLLFVIEGATVRKYETEDSSFACLVAFPDPGDNLILRFDSEKARESWMVKIATCSHQMVRAQLDEMAYKFYTMGVKQDTDVEDPSITNSFYLTNPHKVTHNFAISQQNNLPSRRVSFAEIMSESKLSIVLPLELVKLYKKWITEFACLLESRQHRWPSFAISGLHDVLREVRENSETLEQCSEFLQNYSGPPFRKSTEKHRVAFAPVPTNLHVHHSTVDQRVARGVLSCGTASALPLRFQSGGLTRLSTLLEINQTYHDFNFFSKRQLVMDLKKYLGQLSHRIDAEWVGGSFDKRSKLCSEVADGVKSILAQNAKNEHVEGQAGISCRVALRKVHDCMTSWDISNSVSKFISKHMVSSESKCSAIVVLIHLRYILHVTST